MKYYFQAGHKAPRYILLTNPKARLPYVGQGFGYYLYYILSLGLSIKS
ncbi:hypothetical protein KAW65_05350 [candidate division WOR-3 bacterium]|nr:hypothetical protein [candidate division WOR-3 bacterium]